MNPMILAALLLGSSASGGFVNNKSYRYIPGSTQRFPSVADRRKERKQMRMNKKRNRH